MSFYYRNIIVLSAAVLISACGSVIGDEGYFHDRSNDYLKSKNGHALVIPPHLNRDNISNYYTISKVRAAPATTKLPPGSLKGIVNARRDPVMQAATNKAQLATMKNAVGLVIEQPLAQAFATVGTGLERQHIKIGKADRAAHVYDIVDLYATFDIERPDTPVYRLHLTAMGQDKTQITVKTLSGQPVNKGTQERLLGGLKKGIAGKFRTLGMTEWFRKFV